MFWKWGDAWVHEIFGFLLVVKLDSEFFAEFIFVFAFRQVQHVHFLQQFGRGCPKCISTGGHRRVLEYSHSISFHLMSFQNIDVKIHPPPKKKSPKIFYHHSSIRVTIPFSTNQHNWNTFFSDSESTNQPAICPGRIHLVEVGNFDFLRHLWYSPGRGRPRVGHWKLKVFGKFCWRIPVGKGYTP